MATEQQLIEGIRRADAAGDTASVRALGAELVRMRKSTPAQPQPSAVSSALNSIKESYNAFQSGVGQAKLDAYHALMGGMRALHLAPPETPQEQKQKANFQRDYGTKRAAAQQAHPIAFGLGQYGTEAAYTEPFLGGAGKIISRGGNVLAKAAPRLGNAMVKVGKATATGGLGSGRTAAQTSKLTLGQRAVDLAARSAGGAIAGAGGAALTDQDVLTGAAVGGALPGAAALGGKVAGKIVDMFRSDKVRAAQMFREALGTDLEAARAAFANMAPDDQRMARQILVDNKIEPDTFMALGADVERLKPTDVRLKTEAQTAAARQGLEEAAGVAPGGTATDIRAAAREGRQNVSAEMSPAREEAFQRISGVNDAEALAIAARQRAAEAAALSKGQEDAARRFAGSATFHGESPAFTKAADEATSQAEQTAQEATAQRGVVNDMEDYIHQAAAEGVAPQRAAPLVAKLREMAAQPGTRMDDLQRNTILRVAKKLEAGMDANGMVNPYDMYQLRKTGVNDIIQGFEKKITAGSAPTSGNVQRTEQLALSVRKLIDDTLGPEFKDYLSRSAQGYQAINRQELTGEALSRFKKPSNEGYLGLVGGEEPKTVAKIMRGGPDMENIATVFANDPERWLALKNAENLLQSRNRMGELAQSGAVAANKLIATETPKKLQAATRVAMAASPAGRNIAQGTEQFVSEFMKPKIGEKLAEGFMGGQSANELLNTYPTSLMTDEYISRLSPAQRNALAQMLRGYSMSSNPNAGY